MTVVVHDLQFVSAGDRISNQLLAIELRLRGWSSEADTVRELAVSAGDAAHVRIVDAILDFGRALANPRPAALLGAITFKHAPFGTFRAGLMPGPVDGIMECFVFAPDGRVIGRLALEPRLGLRADARMEQLRAGQWTNRHALALAQSLGRQIGRRLAADLEKMGSRRAAGVSAATSLNCRHPANKIWLSASREVKIRFRVCLFR